MIARKRSFFVFLPLFLSIAGILGAGGLSAYSSFQAERRAARARWIPPLAVRSVAEVKPTASVGADT